MKFKLLLFAMITLFWAACNNDKPKDQNTVDKVAVAPAGSDNFLVDSSASLVTWTGSEPTGSESGTIKVSEGSIQFYKGKPVAGSFTIDMNSLKVTSIEPGNMNLKLAGHLKSADFFSADSFPTARFEITGVDTLPKGTLSTDGLFINYRFRGNMTIKGITNAISFDAQIQGNQQSLMAFVPQFKIDRSFWNVRYKSKAFFTDLKDDFIGDQVDISIKLRAINLTSGT